MAEVIRKLRISEQTFIRWKKKYAGMGVGKFHVWSSWRKRTASSSS